MLSSLFSQLLLVCSQLLLVVFSLSLSFMHMCACMLACTSRFFLINVSLVLFVFMCIYFHLQVTPNLYGNLVANVAAGIAGGTGVMPGGN